MSKGKCVKRSYLLNEKWVSAVVRLAAVVGMVVVEILRILVVKGGK